MSNSKIPSLETYMAQIAHELRALPAQARADELREIEAHLRALIEARGDVAAVLAQFGAPRKIGRELRRAWERKQPEARWRAMVSPLAGLIFFALFSLVMSWAARSQMETLIAPRALPLLIPGIYFFMGVGLFSTGFVMGYISPKRGNLIFLSLIAVFSAISMWQNETTLTTFINAALFSSYFYGLIAVVFGILFGARRGRKLSARIAR